MIRQVLDAARHIRCKILQQCALETSLNGGEMNYDLIDEDEIIL